MIIFFLKRPYSLRLLSQLLCRLQLALLKLKKLKLRWQKHHQMNLPHSLLRLIVRGRMAWIMSGQRFLMRNLRFKLCLAGKWILDLEPHMQPCKDQRHLCA